MRHDEHDLFSEPELVEIFRRAHNEWLITLYGYKANAVVRPHGLTPLPENISECMNCGVGYLIYKNEPCAFCALLLRKKAKI